MKLGVCRERRQALIRAQWGSEECARERCGKRLEESSNHSRETIQCSFSKVVTNGTGSAGACMKENDYDTVSRVFYNTLGGEIFPPSASEQMEEQDDDDRKTCLPGMDSKNIGRILRAERMLPHPALLSATSSENSPLISPEKRAPDILFPNISMNRESLRSAIAKVQKISGAEERLYDERIFSTEDGKKDAHPLEGISCSSANTITVGKNRGLKESEWEVKTEAVSRTKSCGQNEAEAKESSDHGCDLMVHSKGSEKSYAATAFASFLPIRLKKHSDADFTVGSEEDGRKGPKSIKDARLENREHGKESSGDKELKKCAPDFIFKPSYGFPLPPRSFSNPCLSSPFEAVIELRWPSTFCTFPPAEGCLENSQNKPSASATRSPTSSTPCSLPKWAVLHSPPFSHHEIPLHGIRKEREMRTQGGTGEAEDRNDAEKKGIKENEGQVDTVDERMTRRFPLSALSSCAYHPSGGWICRVVACEEKGIPPFPSPMAAAVERTTRISSTIPVSLQPPSSVLSSTKSVCRYATPFSMCPESGANEKRKNEEEARSSPSLVSSPSFPDFSPHFTPASLPTISLSSSCEDSLPKLFFPPPPSTPQTAPSQHQNPFSVSVPPSPHTRPSPLAIGGQPFYSYLSVHQDLLHSCPLLRELVEGPLRSWATSSISPVSLFTPNAERSPPIPLTTSSSPILMNATTGSSATTAVTTSTTVIEDDKNTAGSTSKRNVRNVESDEAPSNRFMWGRVISCQKELHARYGLSHVELSIRGQHVGRADQYRIMEAIRYWVLYSGMTLKVYEFTLGVHSLLYRLCPTSSPIPTLETCSIEKPCELPSSFPSRESSCSVTPTCSASAQLVSVGYGFVTPSTVVNFTSLSPVHYIIFELSQEMWSTATVDGQMPLSWAVKQFFPEFLKRKLAIIEATPLLRLVFTGRLQPWGCTEKLRASEALPEGLSGSSGSRNTKDEALPQWKDKDILQEGIPKEVPYSGADNEMCVMGDKDLASLQPPSSSHYQSRLYSSASTSVSKGSRLSGSVACEKKDSCNENRIPSPHTFQANNSLLSSGEKHMRLAGEVLDIFHVEEITLSNKRDYEQGAAQVAANLEMFLLRIRQGLDRERKALATARRERASKTMGSRRWNIGRQICSSFIEKQTTNNPVMDGQYSEGSGKGTQHIETGENVLTRGNTVKKAEKKGAKNYEKSMGNEDKKIEANDPVLYSSATAREEEGKQNSRAETEDLYCAFLEEKDPIDYVPRFSTSDRSFSSSAPPFSFTIHSRKDETPSNSAVVHPSEGKEKIKEHAIVKRKRGGDGRGRARRIAEGGSVSHCGSPPTASSSSTRITSTFSTSPSSSESFEPNCSDFTCSRESNTIEALALVLQWGNAEMNGHTTPNVHFYHTGFAITVLSAGKGIYDATNAVAQLVCTGLHDIGIEKVHLVCLCRPPLHVTPLFVYSTNDMTLMSQSHLNTDPHYYCHRPLNSNSNKTKKNSYANNPSPGFIRKATAGIKKIHSRHSRPSAPSCFEFSTIKGTTETLYYESPSWMEVFFYYPLQNENIQEAGFGLFTKEEWTRRYCCYPFKCIYTPRQYYCKNSLFCFRPPKKSAEDSKEGYEACRFSSLGTDTQGELPFVSLENNSHHSFHKQEALQQPWGWTDSLGSSPISSFFQISRRRNKMEFDEFHKREKANLLHLMLQQGLGVSSSPLPSRNSLVLPWQSFIPPKWWFWQQEKGVSLFSGKRHLCSSSFPRLMPPSLSSFRHTTCPVHSAKKEDHSFCAQKKVSFSSPPYSHYSLLNSNICNEGHLNSCNSFLQEVKRISLKAFNPVALHPFSGGPMKQYHLLRCNSIPSFPPCQSLWHPRCSPAMMSEKFTKRFVSYLSYFLSPSFQSGRARSLEEADSTSNYSGAVGDEVVNGMMVHREKEGWWCGAPKASSEEILGEAIQRLFSHHVFSRLHHASEWWLASHSLQWGIPQYTREQNRNLVGTQPKTPMSKEMESVFETKAKEAQNQEDAHPSALEKTWEARLAVRNTTYFSSVLNLSNKENSSRELLTERQRIDGVDSNNHITTTITAPSPHHHCRGDSHGTLLNSVIHTSPPTPCGNHFTVQAEWFIEKNVPPRPSTDCCKSDVDRTHTTSTMNYSPGASDRGFLPPPSSASTPPCPPSFLSSSRKLSSSPTSFWSGSFWNELTDEKEESRSSIITSYGTRVLDSELTNGLVWLRLTLLTSETPWQENGDEIKFSEECSLKYSLSCDAENNAKEAQRIDGRRSKEEWKGNPITHNFASSLIFDFAEENSEEMSFSKDASRTQKSKNNNLLCSSSVHFVPLKATPFSCSSHVFPSSYPCSSPSPTHKKSRRVWKPSVLSDPKVWEVLMNCFHGRDGQVAAVYQRWKRHHQESILSSLVMPTEKEERKLPKERDFPKNQQAPERWERTISPSSSREEWEPYEVDDEDASSSLPIRKTAVDGEELEKGNDEVSKRPTFFSLAYPEPGCSSFGPSLATSSSTHELPLRSSSFAFGGSQKKGRKGSGRTPEEPKLPRRSTFTFPSAFKAQNIFRREDSWCSEDGTVLWLATQKNDVEFSSSEEIVLEFFPEWLTTFCCTVSANNEPSLLGHFWNHALSSPLCPSHYPTSTASPASCSSKCCSLFHAPSTVTTKSATRGPLEYYEDHRFESMKGNESVDGPSLRSASASLPPDSVTSLEGSKTAKNKVVVVVANISLSHALLFGISLIDPITGKEHRRGYRTSGLLPHLQTDVSTAQLFQRRWHYAHPLLPWISLDAKEEKEVQYERSGGNLDRWQPGWVSEKNKTTWRIHRFRQLGYEKRPPGKEGKLPERKYEPSTLSHQSIRGGGHQGKCSMFFFPKRPAVASTSSLGYSTALPKADIWYHASDSSSLPSVGRNLTSSWECLCRARLLPLYGVRSRFDKASFIPISTHQYVVHSTAFTFNEGKIDNPTEDKEESCCQQNFDKPWERRATFSPSIPSPFGCAGEFQKPQKAQKTLSENQALEDATWMRTAGMMNPLRVQVAGIEEEAYHHLMEFVWQRLEYNYQIVWDSGTVTVATNIPSNNGTFNSGSGALPRVGASGTTSTRRGAAMSSMFQLPTISSPPSHEFPLLLTICHQQHTFHYIGADAQINSSISPHPGSSGSKNNDMNTDSPKDHGKHDAYNDSDQYCHSSYFRSIAGGPCGEDASRGFVSIVRELHRGRYTAHPWETSTALTYQYALWNLLSTDKFAVFSSSDQILQTAEKKEDGRCSDALETETRDQSSNCLRTAMNEIGSSEKDKESPNNPKIESIKRFSQLDTLHWSRCFQFLPRTLVMQPVLSVKSTIFWETLDKWISRQPLSRQTTLYVSGASSCSLPFTFRSLPFDSSLSSSHRLQLSTSANCATNLSEMMHPFMTSNNNSKAPLNTSYTSPLPSPPLPSSAQLSSVSGVQHYPSALPEELQPRVFQLGVLLLPLLKRSSPLPQDVQEQGEEEKGDGCMNHRKKEKGNDQLVRSQVWEEHMHEASAKENMERIALSSNTGCSNGAEKSFACKNEKTNGQDPPFLSLGSGKIAGAKASRIGPLCNPAGPSFSLTVGQFSPRDALPSFSLRLRNFLWRAQTSLKENGISISSTNDQWGCRSKTNHRVTAAPLTNPLTIITEVPCDFENGEPIPSAPFPQKNSWRPSVGSPSSCSCFYTSLPCSSTTVHVLSSFAAHAQLETSTRIFGEMKGLFNGKGRVHESTDTSSTSLPQEPVAGLASGASHDNKETFSSLASLQKHVGAQPFHGGSEAPQTVLAVDAMGHRLYSGQEKRERRKGKNKRDEKRLENNGEGRSGNHFLAYSCSRFTSLDLRLPLHWSCLYFLHRGGGVASPTSLPLPFPPQENPYCARLTLTWATASAPMVHRIWNLLMEAGEAWDTQFLVVPFPSLWYYRYCPTTTSDCVANNMTTLNERQRKTTSSAAAVSSLTISQRTKKEGSSMSTKVVKGERQSLNKEGKREDKMHIHETRNCMNEKEREESHQIFPTFDSEAHVIDKEREEMGKKKDQERSLKDEESCFDSSSVFSGTSKKNMRDHTTHHHSYHHYPFPSYHRHEWLSHFVTCGYPITLPGWSSLKDAEEFQQLWIDRITNMEATKGLDRRKRCLPPPFCFSDAFISSSSSVCASPREEAPPVFRILGPSDGDHSYGRAISHGPARFEERASKRRRPSRKKRELPRGVSSEMLSKRILKTSFPTNFPPHASLSLRSPVGMVSISPEASSSGLKNNGEKGRTTCSNLDSLHGAFPIRYSRGYHHPFHKPCPFPSVRTLPSFSKFHSSGHGSLLPPLLYIADVENQWCHEVNTGTPPYNLLGKKRKENLELESRSTNYENANLADNGFQTCRWMDQDSSVDSSGKVMTDSKVGCVAQQLRMAGTPLTSGSQRADPESSGQDEDRGKGEGGGCFVHCSGASYIIFYSRSRLRFLVEMQQRMIKARLALLKLKDRVLNERQNKWYRENNQKHREAEMYSHRDSLQQCLFPPSRGFDHTDGEVNDWEEDTEFAEDEKEKYDSMPSFSRLIPFCVPPLPPLVVGEWRQNVSVAHGTQEQWELLRAVQEESKRIYKLWNMKKRKKP